MAAGRLPITPKKPAPSRDQRCGGQLSINCKSKLFSDDLFHKTFFNYVYKPYLQHFLLSTVPKRFASFPSNAFMKHLSLTATTICFNIPPKSFFALSLFNICLQHFSQNTAAFFAATFHTNLQNSTATLLANRHLRLLCKTALKKSSRTCIFVILPYNMSENLSSTALSKTVHYSAAFQLSFLPFFFWKLPTSLLTSQQQLCFQRRKNHTSFTRSSCLNMFEINI